MSKYNADLPAAAQVLVDRFINREVRVGVVGLGYVGLPLAIVLAEAGFHVIGIDLDPNKVERLTHGQSYIEDVDHSQVEPLIAKMKLEVSESYQALEGVDAVSLCVPTPLRKTGDPDLSFIIEATKAIIPILHEEMLVILESTSYPGTTREMVQPEIEASGLQVGKDLFLAFSPERVDPGRKDWTTINTPKVVGGITPACTEVAAVLYGQAMDNVVCVSSTEVAEMTKLLENTFRAVNIGLVNEVALMCNRLGIDVWEVIEAAASKPFGFMKFTPGPGLGGHCIPIDPLYLSWKLKSVKYNARFIELASEINTGMPRYVVERVQDALNDREKPLKGSRILILGVAYKPNVSDTRESPALDVIGLLSDKEADVRYYDPYVPSLDHEGWNLKSVPDLVEAVQQTDCVVVITDHDSVDYAAAVEAADMIFDTRDAIRKLGIDDPKVVRL